MDIRVLRYFLAVAREESITKAAQTLHMTQPPLSRQLKELEEELGKQLFIRGSKKVMLTEDGMLLYKRAEELIDLMEKTKAELNSSDKNINGEIYIGSAETNAVSFFAEAAEILHKKHPLICYRIFSGDAERVLERLDKGLLDFALVVGAADIEKYNYLRLPFGDMWGVLMRKDSPLADRAAISPADLREQQLILSYQAADSSELFSWFESEKSKLNIAVTYNLIYNASHFVKKGLGYAIALDGIINTTGDSELCFRPMFPPVEARLCIVWKKNQVFSRASNAFLDILKNELKIEA